MEKNNRDYSEKLETKRLILRKYNQDDFEMLYENYVSDEKVPMYCTWKPCKTFEEAYELLSSWYRGYERHPEKSMWMIVEKSSNKGIGIIRVTNIWSEDNKCEIGYSMGSEWWGKGYMTEAVREVVNYLTNEIGFNIIVADGVSITNIGSKRVLEKNGFIQSYKNPDGTACYDYEQSR